VSNGFRYLDDFISTLFSFRKRNGFRGLALLLWRLGLFLRRFFFAS